MARKLGKDRQIRVQSHTLNAAHAEREQRPFVLQPSELPLDSATRAARLGFVSAHITDFLVNGWE